MRVDPTDFWNDKALKNRKASLLRRLLAKLLVDKRPDRIEELLDMDLLAEKKR